MKVEEAWRKLDLPARSKAGLCSKWQGIKNLPCTLPDENLIEAQHSSENSDNIATELVPSTTPPLITAEITTMDHNDLGDIDVREINPINAASQPEEEDTADPTLKDLTLTFKKNLRKARKIGCLPNIRKPPKRVSGKHIQPIISQVSKLLNNEIESRKEGCLTWDQLSILVYAGAMTVSELGNQRMAEKIKKSKDWFRNSYRELESLRKTIGKATAELNRQRAEVAPTQQQISNIRLLKKHHKVESFVDITSLVEKLKNRLRLLQSRITLRKADEARVRIRQMPTKVLFRGNETTNTSEVTDVHLIRRYWKSIVGVKKSFNALSPQLVAWENSVSDVKDEGDLKDSLSLELWQRVIQKSKPWKAHGPDGLQGYWWKVFTNANVALYHLVLQHLLTGDPLPQRWIAEGRIVLLHKSGPRSDPSNFRPIACLNTCYKLMTGFVAAYLDQYVRERKLLPSEQVALRGGVWGCTHALTLDQTMTADARYQKQRPISVAWIDYAKAFDSVPHSYIKWLLNAVRVPSPLKRFLDRLMKQWRVKYEVRSPGGETVRSSYLQIRSGVLQGDSFSPLLFCLAMAPISHAINSLEGRYVTASGKLKGMQTSLSHLFYMDDLKLFANSSESLTMQIKVVASISEDISMKLNVKKCAATHFVPKRKRQDQNEEATDAQDDESIHFPILDAEAAYKYLGIEQNVGLKEADAWDRVTDKCCNIERKLWSSDLTFRQKVNSHNTTIIPSICYIVSCMIKGSGKYQSVQKRGKELDQLFRNILTKEKARYKASCVARMYLATELGGYGMKSVRDAIEEATIYSWAYLCTKVELKSSLNLFVNMANRGKRCVVSDAASVLKEYNIIADINVDRSEVTLNGAQFVDARALARRVVELMRASNNTRRYQNWQQLTLAGRVLRPDSNVDVKSSFAWIRDGKLSSTSVRNVIAAQEGCLLTRAHPAWAGTNTDTSCRACRKTTETVEHVVSSCPKWLPNLYIDRHDSVARNIHYKLCQKYDLTPPHFSQKVNSVLENERFKLYWNQPVQTKAIIRHNKPDIIAFDKISKTVLIFEVAVSWFTGIARQIDIKHNRYCINGNWDNELATPYPRGDNLQRELQTGGWKVSFIPVVVGATGEVLSELHPQLMHSIGLDNDGADRLIERLQRSAVLGTSRIIKNHLAKDTF